MVYKFKLTFEFFFSFHFSLPCVPGKHQNEAKQSLCIDCTEGTYSSAANQATCQDCTTGKSSLEGSAACTSCGKGQFQNEVKKESCKDCLVNTFTDVTGLAVCTLCGSEEKAVKGSAKCSKCDAGESGTGVGGTCEACATGQYRTSAMAADSCAPCAVGYAQGTTGQASVSSIFYFFF